jgi:hypothetical protein
MRMRVGPKNIGQVPNAYDSSNLVPNQFWSENTTIQIYFKKTVLFSIWVPSSEERKSNPVPENNLIRSVASNCLVSSDAHDLINRLILIVLVCRLVKINSREPIGSK